MADPRGDIYKVIAKSREHPVTASMDIDGVVFEMVGKKTTFASWEEKQDYYYWLKLVPTQSGYYDIWTDLILEGSASAPEIVGIFVPLGLDKKIVADELRKRFGLGTVLLKKQASEDV